MRMSQAYIPTLREDPSEAETAGHRLLLRGGFIRPMAAGLISFLPLGLRVKHKIEAIIREEMDRAGGQEVSMPVVQPAELWQESGRWQAIGPEMARFKDRAGRDMCLAMTHEEAVTDLVRGLVKSYRELPQCIYQFQTKFRDEPRSRAGLIRVREFTMKDAYSFHADEACLDGYYARMHQAYFDMFRRAGVDVVAVKSDPGMMGGQVAHEFMALSPVGEDTLIRCPSCGYAANRQVAVTRKPEPVAEAPAPLEEVATPGCTSIAEVAGYLGVPESRTAKAVFFVKDEGEFVFVLVRGDMEVNETKLTNLLRAGSLRPAHDEEILAVGAQPGYASPVGLRPGVTLVVDDLVARSQNLVGGANKVGWHLRNTNCGRDYLPGMVGDVVAAAEGQPCRSCGAPVVVARGVEVGNIFKLGTRYSEALRCTFLDKAGVSRPMIMGCYGIGPGRLMGVAAEIHRDERGICWPISIAPYHVHLVSLAGKNPECAVAADRLGEDLERAGLEVLYDDRSTAAPGEKFADADLVGIPLRLTLGPRSFKEGVIDLKRRQTGVEAKVPLGEAVAAVCAARDELAATIRRAVTPVPFVG